MFEITSSTQEEVTIGNLFIMNSRCSCFQNQTTPQSMMIEYLNRMEQFICDVFKDCKVAMEGTSDINNYTFESMKQIKDFLAANCKIEGMICLEIVFGIILGYYNITGMGMERIKKMFRRVKSFAILDSKEEWEKQIEESINMTYIQERYDLINHHMQLHLDEIGWVMKITNNFKVIFEFDNENEEEEKIYLDIDDDFILTSKDIEYSTKSVQS